MDYLETEEKASIRHEFVAGTVYAMSGASRKHVEITRALSGILYRETEGRDCRNLDQDTKVWIEDARAYYYPDATIACPPRFIDEAHGVIDNPTVVFEVLSPSTEGFDRGAKFAAYRALPSLQSYVLIESESRLVEVYSIESGQWVVRFFSAMDAIAEIPSVSLVISLAELYAHVSLSASSN
jgi:Uma2 family endonuclease